MPAWALLILEKLGVLAIEYVQKNWSGEEKVIKILNKYDTPCTVDCEKRGIKNYEE